MPCKLPIRPGLLWRPYRLIPTPTSHHHVHHQHHSRNNRPYPPITPSHTTRRPFSLSSIPTVLLPPLVFTGLLITLWTYKCLMMITFQNKIIYMPSMPPFSRSEKLKDYVRQCTPVIWTEQSIYAADGTALKLLEGVIPIPIPIPIASIQTDTTHPTRNVIIIYFQGNASSLPPRLPFLSTILKLLHNPASNTHYTLVALSYRGFWKSKGRATQRGIELDAQAALEWVTTRYAATSSSKSNTKVILWGQSIGAGVATTALATWQERANQEGVNSLPVSGVLLETPFTSLRAMLVSLYPQKFLPYRYLGPFLMSTWDSVDALSRVSRMLANTDQVSRGSEGGDVDGRVKILLLEAEKDELVPKEDATILYQLCVGLPGLDAEHKVVSGALHTDVMMRMEGKREIVRFLRKFEVKT